MYYTNKELKKNNNNIIIILLTHTVYLKQTYLTLKIFKFI